MGVWWNLVDTVVLETTAKSVRVRILLPLPFTSSGRPDLFFRNLPDFYSYSGGVSSRRSYEQRPWNFEPKIKPPIKMELVNLNKKVPTEREIADVEARLKAMRIARQEAKEKLLGTLKVMVDELPDALDPKEAMHLITILQAKLRGRHRKVRGSPVSTQLKDNLIAALKSNESYTLSQLEKMFGLSVSYISRVKKELGLTRSQGYTDQQLNHQKQDQKELVSA